MRHRLEPAIWEGREAGPPLRTRCRAVEPNARHAGTRKCRGWGQSNSETGWKPFNILKVSSWELSRNGSSSALSVVKGFFHTTTPSDCQFWEPAPEIVPWLVTICVKMGYHASPRSHRRTGSKLAPPYCVVLLNHHMKNALTVDLEDYYHVSAFDHIVSQDQWGSLEQRVERNTDLLIHNLAKNAGSGRFFYARVGGRKNPADHSAPRERRSRDRATACATAPFTK